MTSPARTSPSLVVPLPCLGGHGYAMDGSVFPSVTTALQSCGLAPDFSDVDAATIAHAASRGTLVHARCAGYWLDSGAVLDGVPDEWAGYVVAFCDAARALHLEPEVTECMVSSPRLRLAGRVDFIGRDAVGDLLLDYKTGAPDAGHALQTAAYALLAQRRTIRRACLYLRPDGGWSLVEHSGWSDYSIIEAVAIVANARLDRFRRGEA